MIGFLTSKVGLGVIAALLVLAGVWFVFHKGEKSGANAVTSAVEHATNDATEKARKDKEAADEKARTDPLDAVILRTR